MLHFQILQYDRVRLSAWLPLTFDELIDFKLLSPLAVDLVILAFDHVLAIRDFDAFEVIISNLGWKVNDLFLGHLAR
jgi:hypothetical protein